MAIFNSYVKLPEGKSISILMNPILGQIPPEHLLTTSIHEVTVLDDKEVRRRFRASNYQSTTRRGHRHGETRPGQLTVCYWKWPFIVDWPIENGDFP